MSRPLDRFQQLLDSSELLFVVVYRGHWCPFCMSYLKSLQSLTQSIEKRSGAVVAITSQVESETVNTKTASGFTGTIISDENNEIVTELTRRNIAKIAIDPRKGYSAGMAQPAVIVLRNWDEVLYSWAIVPSLMNINGAKDRPDLGQVWDNVQAKLDGQSQKHQKIKAMGALGLIREKLLG